MKDLERLVDVAQWLAANPVTECVAWWGGVNSRGYGMVKDWTAKRLGLSLRVHRAVYAAVHGPIADGLEISHGCHARLCINPAHLEAVTRDDHMRRDKPVHRHGHLLNGISGTGQSGIEHVMPSPSGKSWYGSFMLNKLRFYTRTHPTKELAASAALSMRTRLRELLVRCGEM